MSECWRNTFRLIRGYCVYICCLWPSG